MREFNFGVVASSIVASPSLITAGLLADYRMDEGSGTVLHDSSPNAHDSGTFAGTGFTWSSGGLAFGGGTGTVPLSAVPIGSIVTVQVAFTTAMAATGGAGAWIIGSDDISVGWAIFTGGNLPTTENPPQTRPYIWPGSPVSYSYSMVGVPALYTFRRGASSNSVYVNDIPAVLAGAMEAPASPTGNLYLGGTSGWWFAGTLHRVVLYDRLLSDAEILDNYATIAANCASRGVTLKGPNPTSNRVLIVEGDSITYGYLPSGRLTTPWPAGMTLSLSYDVWNVAMSGQSVATINATGYDKNSVLCQADRTKNVAVIFAGTNDTGSGSAIFANLQAVVNKYLTRCAHVIAVPMLSRAGADTIKNDYNAIINSTWGGGAITGVSVVPTSSMPHLVPDGSYADTTYFQSDQLHPTQAGADEIGGAVAAVINAL